MKELSFNLAKTANNCFIVNTSWYDPEHRYQSETNAFNDLIDAFNFIEGKI